MLGAARTKKLNSRKMLDGTDLEKASLTEAQFTKNAGGDWYKKAPITQYVKAGTKKLNSRKILDGTGIEKVPLSQYVRWGWREKPLFTENDKGGWYKKTLVLNMLAGVGMKPLFTENARAGWF